MMYIGVVLKPLLCMRLLILSGILFLSVYSFGQKDVYSKEEIRRIGDLGRLWGAIHYFHPEMGTGNVSTDELALKPISMLLSDASARGFTNSIKNMLEILGDKTTFLVDKQRGTRSAL